MSYQPSHTTKVDVGTPSAEFLSSEPFYWSDNVEVRFHDFVVEAARLEGMGGFQSYIFSPEFTVFGHQWQLALLPRSITSSDAVGIYIKHLSEESITIRFGANTKNSNGDRGRDFTTTYWSEFGPNDMWGRFNGELGTRAEITRNLVNGTLVVEVRMAQFNADSKPQKVTFIPENPLHKSILSKFMDEQSSDIVFEVSGSRSNAKNNPKRTKASSTFFAHRLILQDWKGVSFGELGEDSTPIAISGVKPDIFHHLLFYSYGGKVGEEDLKANAREIVDAADKYGIVGLKLEAEATLVAETIITIENAMNNLLYADAKNLALFKEAVMDFLVENGEEAIKKIIGYSLKH